MLAEVVQPEFTKKAGLIDGEVFFLDVSSVLTDSYLTDGPMYKMEDQGADACRR
jgi:hypothetical protein